VSVVLAVGAVAAAGASLATLARRPAVPPAPGEQLSASPDQISVVDAGTLRLGDRIVRLKGVEPPSHSTACSDQDCGAAAANALSAMMRETAVVCRLSGADGSGRAYAVCQAGPTELNLAVVAAGWARAGGDAPDLKAAEQAARNDRRGVWAHNPRW
jgi:endonuclease YncB( thermonuclease family)